MPSLETAIRLIVIGQGFLIAAVFLFGRGNRAARTSGALLMLGVVSYLYISSSTLRGALPAFEPVIKLLTLSIPFFLWFFARSVFAAPWLKPAVTYAVICVGLTAWGIHFVEDMFEPEHAVTSGRVIRVLSLLVVAHALWLVLSSRPDDLVERRRLFSLFFVGVISLQVAAVLVVEIVLGVALPPTWLDLTNVIIISLLTLGLAIPMMRLNAAFFAPEEAAPAGNAGELPGTKAGTGDVFRKRLLELMADGYYRQTGLTIPMLAQKLEYPEHQLRRLINGRLGYRNYSAFLNSYRIEEAKSRLGDPDNARTPVLTIALDLGYGSLGPFNRAFKATTGMTPTDFRHQQLGGIGADSE